MSYIKSPLANSTKISKNLFNENSDGIVSTHLIVSNSSHLSIRKRSTIKTKEKDATCNDATIQEVATEDNLSSINISVSSANAVSSNNEIAGLKKSPRKLIVKKKPVLNRKVNVKKVTEPIKAIAYNDTSNKAITVERILKQINMTKYQQSFKKIDVAKFKELKEIDLNAIGITRPSEIRIFMDAVKKTKSDILF